MAVAPELVGRLEAMAEDMLNRDCMLTVKRCVRHRASGTVAHTQTRLARPSALRRS